MSWSINLMGRAGAVAKAFAEKAKQIKCSEPEEGAKEAVVGIVEKFVATMPDAYAIRVEASGSQSSAYDAATGKSVPGKLSHSLSLKFETLWGFVE